MKTVLLIFLLISASCVTPSHLKTKYQWKYFDYDWQSSDQKTYYSQNNLYNPKNMVPIDVDRSKDGRTFVTIIRTNGVPASLHTVTDKVGPSGPLLKPYPDWTWYENYECDKIISVYRIAIDRCNRIWVLDTGIVDEKKICTAKLLAFSLTSNKLLLRKDIGDNYARNASGNGLLVTPIVETFGERCSYTRVYMADVDGNGLVVWDNNRLYRLNADVFKPEERNANFTIAGESFNLQDGVLGMALSPFQYPFTNRYLAFRPLASRSLYLLNTRFFSSSKYSFKYKVIKGKDVLPSQTAAQVFSSKGILFYVLTHEMAIGCWNMNMPLTRDYFGIVLTDPERLQFASGMKVFLDLYGNQQLLMMTNRLQKIYAGTMNFTEINFRVMSASIRSLIRGTVCEKIVYT